MKYARSRDRSRQKRKGTAKRIRSANSPQAVDDFDRQSKAFIATIEDKALKNKLEKERQPAKPNSTGCLSKVQGPADQESAYWSRTGRNTTVRECARLNAMRSRSAQKSSPPSATSAPSRKWTKKSPRSSSAACVSAKRSRTCNSPSQQRHAEKPSRQAPKSRRASSTLAPSTAADAPAELNLIGKTTADAEYELDRFLDEAYIASLPRVRIIHGFGTGH